jgi:radical SAM superfamily enzyme YgiQ (UPF0313 family)
MEPLPIAVIASHTPKDVELSFFDDRMEPIPFDHPTDLVAISIETYTAKRAYQIASGFRERGVPVVMGGFHATLCPEEVAQYANSVVVGEAEGLWAQVIDDYRHNTPLRFYRLDARPSLLNTTPNRSIYGQRNYLPVSLVEVGRGCEFQCEFCAIQTVFNKSYTRRPVDEIIQEITHLKRTRNPKIFFIVDDNFIAHPKEAKEILRALIPLKIRWVSQASINVAHDDEMLDLLRRSGCSCLLIGFESLNSDNLRQMKKEFNMMRGGFEASLERLRRARIRLYVTFLLGYDHDTPDTVRQSVEFAKRHNFYIAAFNHVTPFPGTALYDRLKAEGRLVYERWWLDDDYSYATIPFRPTHMTAQQLHDLCVQSRKDFYSIPSILKRSMGTANRGDFLMFRNFFPINLMHTFEVSKRDHHPLGDVSFRGPLLKVA